MISAFKKIQMPIGHLDSFSIVFGTLRHLPEDKQVFWFLLAFFCYIDGVYTIIDMATAYGTALGLDTTGLLLALLVIPSVQPN